MAQEQPVGVYKTSEAAQRLNVSPNTLRSWERRFGSQHFGITRSKGGQRAYNQETIHELATILREGSSISSAVTILGNSIDLNTTSVLRDALKNFDSRQANRIIEKRLSTGVRPVESLVTEMILPAAQNVLEHKGRQSLHWDQASRWGIDWLGRLAAYAPAVAGNQIWMADATSGPTDPDAIQKAALSLFCQRLGNEVLTISIGSTKGFRDMTSERPPDRVVLAGKEAGWPAISQWAFSFRSETDLRVQDTFLAGGLSKEGEPTPTRTLSSEPLTAARQIIDML